MTAEPKMNTAKEWLWYYFCGLCQGTADLVPGVSGGTIAFILGYYPYLIHNIGSVNLHTVSLALRFRFSELSNYISWKFILALLIGVLTTFASLSNLVSYWLNHEDSRVYLYAVFFGLILASVVFCAKKIKKFQMRHLFIGLIGAIAAFFITSYTVKDAKVSEARSFEVTIAKNYPAELKLRNYDASKNLLKNVDEATLGAMVAKGIIDQNTPVIETKSGIKGSAGDFVHGGSFSYINPWFIFCGAIAICAMLLPGISGSYLLTILGVYPLAIAAVADLVAGFGHFTFDVDAFFLLSNILVGIVIGAVSFSRVVDWLLHHYHDITIACLIGVMIGAMHTIWPFWSYDYVLMPLKLDRGPILEMVNPVLPDFTSPLFLTTVLVALTSFTCVFLLEYLALKKK